MLSFALHLAGHSGAAQHTKGVWHGRTVCWLCSGAHAPDATLKRQTLLEAAYVCTGQEAYTLRHCCD